MKRTIKRLVDTFISPLGFELARKGAQQDLHYHHSMPTCEERLRHAKSIGFNPSEIVDAGAYVGGWTKMASTLFPDSRCLVIEPNPYVQEQLVSTLADLKDKAVLVAKALGEEPGSLLFNIWGDPNEATSASLQSHVRGDPDTSMTVDVATLDGLLKAHRLKPDLVKLDLQGAEYGALMGATAALKSVEMFIVEFGCLDAYIDRTTPRQLMEVFYDNDYCLYDVVDCHYRPYDGALTGGDFFFVKNDSPLREHKGWD